MTKLDFKKTLDSYQARPGEFRLIDVPGLHYLMIDGQGDPNTSPVFAAAIAALYPLAYGLKFASKRELGKDYTVMPLEGRWWSEDLNAFTVARDKSRWNWTLMVMQPDWITEPMFRQVLDKVAAKQPSADLDRVRLEVLEERLCVQTLHIGSFDDEADLLARMHHEFIPAHGLNMVGQHHEIYLSDFRRVAPEKLRTILRQPVARG